jgi:hypothetical protein
MHPRVSALTTPDPVSDSPPPRSRLKSLLYSLFSYPAALAAGLVTVTSLTAAGRLGDPDIWWHMRIGEILWNTGKLPTADLFSFTAYGHPWIPHEWLSGFTLYLAYRAGGYSGLVLWTCLLGSLVYLVVYLLCWRVSHDALVSFRGGIVAFCFGSVGLSPRPLLIGHLLLALEILVLELARTRRTRWMWFLPPIFVLWVNCHGSYVFGFGVLAIYCVCAFLRRTWGPFVLEPWISWPPATLAGVVAACVAAVFVNPVGIRLVLYPFDLMFRQKDNLTAIEEWFPPSLGDANTIVMLAALGAVLLLAASRKLSIREILLVCVVTVLACQHRRMLFLFGIITAPVLSHFGFGAAKKREHPFANAVLITGCAAAVALLFPDGRALENQVRSSNPVQAVEYVRRANVAGPMLNEFRFGGYLIWNLRESRVFIDGRTDVFDWTGVMREYLRWASLGEDPQLLLDKYGIRSCLLYRGSAVAHVLPHLPGWKQAYADDLAIVFTR